MNSYEAEALFYAWATIGFLVLIGGCIAASIIAFFTDF